MLRARSHRLLTILCLFASLVLGRANRDYSKEGFIIEDFSRRISFASDGTWESEQTAAIRVQSDAGVQQFGILSFHYDRDNQDVKVVYLRVRKPDGSIVATPPGGVQDVSSDVSKVAPTYSDLREKQIPVKALGVGDVIEYSVRLVKTKPEIAGQFWYAQNFMTDAVVLSEKLELSVPADKYVQVVSPKFAPEVRAEAGRKIYLWKTAQLEPTVRDQNKATPPPASVPSVQVTTFRSWDEIARWYANLQNERLAVTPAIRAKAAQLTEGLSSPAEKERALYNFVSTNFRYVSLSFGVGRYQPHAAEEVLANQYGDCKDKHTLFAALLKAVGIEAWPALIGSGLKLDPTVPSPAQFNHVITVIPGREGYLWLDTTPEVAPFGLLAAQLRDQKALVISPDKAALIDTPADPPFPASQVINVQTTLKPDGMLTGHFDLTVRGDVELLMRSAFHQVPPVRWPDLVQGSVRLLGFGGTVSNVVADNPDELDKPFHYSYDYTRPNYSDWPNHRISPPLPPLLLPTAEDAEAPAEPFFLGAPGELDLRAEVVLPAGYSAELLPNAKASAEFADFESSYALKDGRLEVRRRLVIKQSKIAIKDWNAYKKFAGEVSSDHDGMIQLNEHSASNNIEAARLVAQAAAAGQRHDLNAARDYLSQAERLNPKQLGLWSARALLYLGSEEPNKAVEALEKEIQFHADNLYAYRLLAYIQGLLHKPDEEMQTLRKLLTIAPTNEEPQAIWLTF